MYNYEVDIYNYAHNQHKEHEIYKVKSDMHIYIILCEVVIFGVHACMTLFTMHACTALHRVLFDPSHAVSHL